MSPDIVCTCLFGNPVIGMDHNCPIHGIRGRRKEIAEPVREQYTDFGKLQARADKMRAALARIVAMGYKTDEEFKIYEIAQQGLHD